jgi:hypothetical protein
MVRVIKFRSHQTYTLPSKRHLLAQMHDPTQRKARTQKQVSVCWIVPHFFCSKITKVAEPQHLFIYLRKRDNNSSTILQCTQSTSHSTLMHSNIDPSYAWILGEEVKCTRACLPVDMYDWFDSMELSVWMIWETHWLTFNSPKKSVEI